MRVAGQEMTTSKGQGTLNLFGFSSFGFVTLLKLQKIDLVYLNMVQFLNKSIKCFHNKNL